jgi:exocyst complex component 7
MYKFIVMFVSFNRDARASALQLSLQNLGVEKLDKDDVQRMQWEFLQTKIGNWNQFMQIAVRVLFKV